MVSEWFFRVRAAMGGRRALMQARGAGAGTGRGVQRPLSGLDFRAWRNSHGNFTPVMFVAAFLASVSGDVVARLLDERAAGVPFDRDWGTFEV